MTKKVISSLILIVLSLVCASVLFAYGGTKDFDIIFNVYEAKKITVSFTDKNDNPFTGSLDITAGNECKIVFNANSAGRARVIFNLFEVQDSTTTSTISYTVTLFSENSTTKAKTALTNYNPLAVDANNKTGDYFNIATGTSKYPLKIVLNSDDLNDAIAGSKYQALIVVETVGS